MMLEMMEPRKLFAATSGFDLIDADTHELIRALDVDATINLAALGERSINLRVNVAGAKRVVFQMNGQHERNDPAAEFTIASPTEGWEPAIGRYSLQAIAFGNDDWRLRKQTLNLNVIDVPTRSIAAASDEPTQPALAGDWELSFNENFNLLDTNTWSYRYWWNGDVGDEGEQQMYHARAVKIADGNLNITVSQKKARGYDGEMYRYQSGLITTGGIRDRQDPGFTFQYGYAEARIKVPRGQGIWPAFWMLPESYEDSNGEIDIMELIGSRPTHLQTHYHVQDEDFGDTHTTEINLAADFHTYAVNWQEDSITWYIDGQEVFNASENIIAEPMYLLLNVAVGGNWAGNPDSTTPLPATMQVDYVRVWQQP